MALSKNLMAIAGESLKANITTLGPLVLPISEQLLFFMNLIGRKVRGSCAVPAVSTIPDAITLDSRLTHTQSIAPSHSCLPDLLFICWHPAAVHSWDRRSGTAPTSSSIISTSLWATSSQHCTTCGLMSARV